MAWVSCAHAWWRKCAVLKPKAGGASCVLSTEYCSIHPSSDDLPQPYASMWNQGDIKTHALMTEKVHEHGALAGHVTNYLLIDQTAEYLDRLGLLGIDQVCYHR
jgi:hypothetical protein